MTFGLKGRRQILVYVECPFFKYNKPTLRLSCEMCLFKFPDKLSRDNLVLTYCAGNYKDCALYKILINYYDRKEFK